MPWDPEQYLKFQSERFAPFDDLLAMLDVRPGLRVLDLGCGTGELTDRLAVQLRDSDVVGIDASTEMLARARPLARPGLRFEQRTIEAMCGEPQTSGGREPPARRIAAQWDLVFSHAALQWVDGHAALIPTVFALVAPGGQMAVQMPSNHDHASHILIRETAGEEPFRAALGGWIRSAPVLSIDAYAAILYTSGAARIEVVERVYPHVLENADAIADWVRGTALVPYLERLRGDLGDMFLVRYRDKLRAHWPTSPVFYPFRRILFVATKPA